MSSTSAVAVLAQGLRELRDFAEGPDGEQLQERTGLTTEQIDAALAGERLPTREVTLALVEAWEGDVEAWREYWGQIAELAEEAVDGEEKQKAKTPTPPEPSIITPIPEGDDAVEAEVTPEFEAEAGETDEVDEESARAEAEAGGEAEPEAAAVVGQEQALRQETAGELAQEQEQEQAAAKVPAQGEAVVATEVPAQGTPEPEQAARAEAGAAGSAGSRPVAEKIVPAQRSAESSEDAARLAARKTQSSPVLEGVVVAGGAAQPARRGMLARVGIPILLFAIGVGVGAFGDHALNSKQSSKDAAASVPPVASSSKPSHTPASSGSASSSSSPSSSSSATPSSVGDNPSGSTSPTGSSTSSSGTSTVAPGSVIGTYVGIQLASGYSVNFLSDAYHPATGTADGPDTMGFFATSFVDGRFYADRVAILDATDTGSYTSCLNDTRYQHDVLLSQVAANSSFCITTGTGHLVLVTVRRMPSSTDANPYAVVDVTVWQSS